MNCCCSMEVISLQVLLFRVFFKVCLNEAVLVRRSLIIKIEFNFNV